MAADFLQDPRVQGWLDGVEPDWTLLTLLSDRGGSTAGYTASPEA